MLTRLFASVIGWGAQPVMWPIGCAMAIQQHYTPDFDWDVLPMPETGRHRALSDQHGAMRHDLGVLARERAS